MSEGGAPLQVSQTQKAGLRARGSPLSHLLQLLPPLPPTAARVGFSMSGAVP